LQCFATDKRKTFIQYACQGRYPVDVIDSCSEGEKRFSRSTGDKVEITDEGFKGVSFLPATEFAMLSGAQCFDVVVLNAFVDVPRETQSAVIEKTRKCSSQWFVTTDFHQKTITDDLKRHFYQPILTNIEEIHSSRSDRFSHKPVPPDSLPPNIFADRALQRFSRIKDYEYRYCALFTHI